MNTESTIMTLVTTLMPNADLSMRLTNSSERYVIIETGLIRCNMNQSNKGTSLDPDWAAPNVRYIMQYGMNGYTHEQSQQIANQIVALNMIFAIFVKGMESL